MQRERKKTEAEFFFLRNTIWSIYRRKEWMNICIACKISTRYDYVINNFERKGEKEFNCSGSLQMARIKMSLFIILLAEKRERGKKLTLLPSPALLREFGFFFSLAFFFLPYIAFMETTIAAKTQRSRTSSDDAFLERLYIYVCSSFFLFHAQAYVTTYSFSYFFARFACIVRPKQRKARPPPSSSSSSLSYTHTHIYTQ